MTVEKLVQSDKCLNPISQRAKRISPSGIRKFFDLLASMEGVISLGVGEPDYITPWHIREAAIYSIEKGLTMYTSNLGMPELRLELSQYLKGNYNLDYNPNSELLITVGVMLDTVQQIESHLLTRHYEGFTGPKGPRIRGRSGRGR